MGLKNALSRMFTGRSIIKITVKQGKAGKWRWFAVLKGKTSSSDVRGFDTSMQAVENAKTFIRVPYHINVDLTYPDKKND